jgi:hypothetical protein
MHNLLQSLVFYVREGQAGRACIVQSLEHALQHSRPFGAYRWLARLLQSAFEDTHMSMCPSCAARSSICSLDIILASICHLSQNYSPS